MNSSMKVIILVVILVSLVSTVVIAAPPALISGCNKFNSTGKDNCISEFALNLKDIKYCYAIKSSKIRDSCYVDIAAKLKSRQLCANFPTAGKNKTALQGVKDLCFTALAKGAKDKNYCKSVVNNQSRIACQKSFISS
jgi:hypothetical protein